MKRINQCIISIAMLFTMLLSSVNTFAYSYEENGIYYSRVGTDEVAVVVGYDPYAGQYGIVYYTRGDVVIPEYTSRGDRVVGIYDKALIYATSVEMPKSIRVIGKEAFAGSTIKSIKIPKFVGTIDSTAFKGCTELEKLEIDPENLFYDSREGCNGLIRTWDSQLMYMCTNSSVIPNSVEIIADEVFRDRTDITSLKLPENLKRIGNYAFYGCTGLTELTMPDNLEHIGDYAFYDCTSVTKLFLPKTLKSVGKYAFYDTKNIQNEVIIPNDIKYIGDYAFYNNSGIKELLLAEDNLYLGERAFDNCTGLESAVFYSVTDDTVTYFEVLAYDRNIIFSFRNCVNLKKVVISKSIPIWNSGPFWGCSNLETIEVDIKNPVSEYRKDCNVIISYYVSHYWSGGVAPGNEVITGEPYYMVAYANENSYIPNDDKVTVIGKYSFYGNMTRVTIPKNIKNIKSYAFSACEKLTDLYMCSSIPPEIESSNSFYDPKQITVHVPKGALDNYIYLKWDWTKMFKAVVEWDYSGVEDIEVDESEDAPAVYYNLQGVRVENPENGIFIKKQAGKTTKVVL